MRHVRLSDARRSQRAIAMAVSGFASISIWPHREAWLIVANAIAARILHPC